MHPSWKRTVTSLFLTFAILPTCSLVTLMATPHFSVSSQSIGTLSKSVVLKNPVCGNILFQEHFPTSKPKKGWTWCLSSMCHAWDNLALQNLLLKRH
ncbi:Protein of unknown function [Gryllus bimaculatus]|nr:Protein of unknown function [Gryllus bimaculatus]